MSIRKILITVAIIAAIIVAAGYWLVYPYLDYSLDVIDKPIEVNQKLEVELPDLPNTDELVLGSYNNTEQIKPVEQIEPESDLSSADENLDEAPEDSFIADNIYYEEQKTDEIFNVVICGMDARNYEERSRSDSIMIASYNMTDNKVSIVSVMRDCWVYLPGRGYQRVNAATAYGGPGLLINTLNHNFDLDIQNYVQIKFDDFKYIIDALGGVEVKLSKSEINYINNKLHKEDFDWKNDIKGEPGVINLNGAQALWHCRNRSVGNSDFDRTSRQRDVFMALASKCTDMGLTESTKLFLELRNKVSTNISVEELINILYNVLTSDNIEMSSARIPFDNTYWYANKNGASVIDLNLDKNKEELHKFLGYEEA